MTTPATPVFASTERPENILGGALLALVAIPAGAIVWVIIWSFGFVASIVSLGVAVFAVWLYRKGSGGRISGLGVLVIAGVVLVTLLVGFWAGLLVDYANYSSSQSGYTVFELLANDSFWQSFAYNFSALLEQNGFNFLLSLAFGALGAFGVIRQVFKASKAGDAAVVPGAVPPGAYLPPAAFTTPEAPAAPPAAGAYPPPPAAPTSWTPPTAPPSGPILNPGTTGTLNSPTTEPPKG